MYQAFASSAVSIITSSLILTAAGLSVGIMSEIVAINEMGFLIGRGAFLSGLLVLIILPQALVICDKVIMKTTYQAAMKK